ncbi:MAG: hypothetical protein R2764_23760 [Bacteroidales bacterium]
MKRKKPYDILKFRKPDGEDVTYYFTTSQSSMGSGIKSATLTL